MKKASQTRLMKGKICNSIVVIEGVFRSGVYCLSEIPTGVDVLT